MKTSEIVVWLAQQRLLGLSDEEIEIKFDKMISQLETI